MAGKKSRCKDCKEVFTIPAPLSPPPPPPREPAPATKSSSLGLRNFTVIPEEVISRRVVEEFAEFEPVEEVRRAPKPVLEEEPLELAPRRAAYPNRSGRSSRRDDVDTEVGVTVAGAYVALAILGFIILAIWHAVGEPGSARVGRVFGASLLILYVLGLLMGSWGGIWLLVIAFRDTVMQGVLCLCVPLYPVFYMLSRWRETRGIVAMSFAPLGVLILFALFGGYVIGLKGPTTFFDRLGERLDSLVPEVAPRVDSARLAEAERLCRDYIQAMRTYTDELSRIQSIAPGQLNRAALDGKGARMDSAERRVQSFKLTKNELTALKSSLGGEMRSAIIALKYELTRLDSLPRLRGQFGATIAGLDRLLTEWEAPIDGGAAPQLADASPPTFVAPSPRPSGLLPPGGPSGFRPGGMQPGLPPRGFETFDTHYNRLRSQYGDRAVMVVLSGLPTNSEAARGVTKRDVEDAIDKRLKALAPESHQSMSTGSGDGRTMCIAPVDDVKGLAGRIDFGKVSLNGSRIDIAVSGAYIASVPRLPAAPSVAARLPSASERGPEIPADADPLTKSLLQLKSADNFRKKDALQRLTRVKPTNKQKEVLEAILPLLDHDDDDLVKHAVRVLAVWHSPEALAKLSDLVNDSRVFLRWEIIKALGKYDEPKAAEALIERLKEDGHQAEEALRSMGQVAEPPLIALLRNPDADLRKKACEVLKFVGGAATLKAMKSIPPDPEFFVRVAAQDAIKMINLRVGPPTSDVPETKKNATNSSGKTKQKS
jgi:hypothetical protein